MKMNTGGKKNDASKNGRAGRNDRADGTDMEEHRHGTENRQSGQSIKSNQVKSKSNGINHFSPTRGQVYSVHVNQGSSSIQPKTVQPK
jgi:hypothetical protein